MATSKMLTPSDLAEQLNVPLATVRQWRYTKVGPQGLRVGRHVRYRQEDVDAWIESQIAGDANAPIAS